MPAYRYFVTADGRRVRIPAMPEINTLPLKMVEAYQNYGANQYSPTLDAPTPAEIETEARKARDANYGRERVPQTGLHTCAHCGREDDIRGGAMERVRRGELAGQYVHHRCERYATTTNGVMDRRIREHFAKLGLPPPSLPTIKEKHDAD